LGAAEPALGAAEPALRAAGPALGAAEPRELILSVKPHKCADPNQLIRSLA
jgi:hypothetical protein